MTTYISIHNAHGIIADAGGTSGAPVSISANHGRDSVEVTLFTGDFALSRKLAAAINATVREHRESLAVKKTEAA